jgi:hypothetical protein
VRAGPRFRFAYFSYTFACIAREKCRADAVGGQLTVSGSEELEVDT